MFADRVLVLALLGSLLGATNESTPIVSDAVLVGAGDIASCSQDNDSATAALLDEIDGTVFTVGDNVYGRGTPDQFADCYDPTWGRHRDRTRPAAGNHDYKTRGASGYFAYFGASAGDPERGYYSYDLGAWHVVVLNSNCGAIDGCDDGSPQMQWLKQDLAAHQTSCAIAYWHHPRFSSGKHGDTDAMTTIWTVLDDAGVDVVIAGHDHIYERFAPQDAQGRADGSGIRSFVVGTGGEDLYDIKELAPNSEIRNNETHGVLKLTLHSDGYDWQFVPVAGSTFSDSGSDTCL